MATEDNHIIRIILEGKDRLSGAFKNARKSVEGDLKSLEGSAAKLSANIKKAEDDMQKFGRRQSVQGRRGFTSLENAREDLQKLQKDIDDFKRRNRSPLTTFFAGGGPKDSGGLKDAVSGLSQGLKEARETGKNVQAALGTAREEVRLRRAALDEQTRAGQARITQLKFEHQQALNEKIEQLKADHFKAQENRRQINTDRAARRQAILDEKKAALDLANELKKVDIKAKAREITSPLSIERRKAVQAGDTDAVLAIDRELARARTVTKKLVAEEDARTRGLKKNLDDRVKARNRADKDTLTSRIRANRAEVQSEIASDRTRLQAAASRLQRIFSAKQTTARAQLTSPDTLTIRQDLARVRNEANETSRTLDNAFKRSGRVIGLWAGDFKRGISEGRQGLSKFGDEADKLDSRVARLGRTVGRAIGQFGNLINLRWFLLTSAVQLVGTLVVALGTNLISVASSAALAAAQIGSVFAAAAAQALPVIGLFAAVSNRVQNVFKAVQLQSQNKIATASESTAQLSAVRESAEKLSDALYSVKQAYQAVQEAQYSLKQSSFDIQDALQRNKEAVTNLAQARIDVSRGLVDSLFRERDANIALKEAELGVIDAKKELIRIEREQKQNQQDVEEAKGAVREAQQRLEAAKKEADATGIANAQAQLAVAQQSLSAIRTQAQTTNTAVKEGKLAVDRAKLARDEAKVEKQRAGEDNRRLQSEGVEGNPQVVAARRELAASVRAISAARHQQHIAQQQVANSFHALKIAQRELKDIEQDRARGLDNQISSQRQLKALLDQLSPSERKLYESLGKIQDVYRRAFRPITDIIVRAITRAVDRATILLKDPKIIKAFESLAKSISAGIDKISKFTLTPEFRKSLEFFINQAAKNMPKVIDIFLNLLDAFIQLAKIGAKPFSGFLTFLDNTTGKLDKFLNNKDKTDKFFAIAKENLDSWISLGSAIGKIFLALGKGSNSAGKSLIDDLVGRKSTTTVVQGPGPASGQVISTPSTGLTHISEFLDKNPEKVRKFFDDMKKILEGLVKSLVSLGPVLLQAFASPGAAKFAEFIVKVVVPGLVLAIQLIQTFTGLILKLNNIPLVGGAFTLFVQFLVAEKALNKIFPVTQKITDVVKALGANAIKAFPAFVKLARTEGLWATLGARFPKISGLFSKFATGFTILTARMSAALVAFRATAIGAFVTNPWVLAIVAIIAIVVLLDRKFHFLKPTIEAIKRAAEFVFSWFKDHWKLLVGILFAPFALAFKLIKKFAPGVIGLFKDILDWFKNHWKDILKLITKPFTAALDEIKKFPGQVIHLFTSVIDWVRKHWKTIATIIIAIFLFPGGAIALAIFKWHDKMIDVAKKVVNGIVGWFKKLPGLILKAITGLPKLILDLFKDIGKEIVKSIVDKIPGAKKALEIGGKALKKVGDIAEKADPRKLKDLIFKASGGIIPKAKETVYATVGYQSRGTDTVPAMLTPGEWVLNSIQQSKLAQSLGTSKQSVADYLFGSGHVVAPNESNPQRKAAGFDRSMFKKTNKGKGLPGFEGFSGPGFTLAPHQDENGVVVWFAEFADKTYGQVNSNDASKILSSSGQFIPSYLNKAARPHGGLLPGHRMKINTAKKALSAIKQQRISTTGAVGHVQAFAQGGPVLNAPAGNARVEKNLHQKFEVHTQGETDWNYVMRLGAIHAQESY